MNQDAHIKLTAQVAYHEHGHAYIQKDYATATHWSVLWYQCIRTLHHWNKVADSITNSFNSSEIDHEA